MPREEPPAAAFLAALLVKAWGRRRPAEPAGPAPAQETDRETTQPDDDLDLLWRDVGGEGGGP